ncbi:hypothetical protein MLD38_026101 [Melastoma candidum]|uniref:Uncharacterized protein n=1 Tax=Melastoma candidum TaxID=119954 RepID=A0ACB9NYF9_9MYRT|nr:hypothetical protein MLD38_026101 [Melastoma candidum]
MVLSCLNVIIIAGIVVVGLFGMNVHTSVFDSTTYTKFFSTVQGAVGGSIAMSVIAFGQGKKRDVFSYSNSNHVLTSQLRPTLDFGF